RFENLVKQNQMYVKSKNKDRTEKKEKNKKAVKINITEDCEDCQAKLEGIPNQKAVEQLSEMSPQIIYEALKKKYQESKLCNPIYNYPEKDAKALALSGLDSISKSCSTWGKDAETLRRLCGREIERL